MEPHKQLYLYDILVLSSDPPLAGDEDSALVYSVRLFKEFVDIPLDRQVEQGFPNEPLGQLLASPCELTGALAAGVCVTLRRDNEVLGSGQGTLPPLFLRQLSEPTFVATHVMQVELLKRKKPVATVELNIKMQSTHPDLDPSMAAFGCFDVCRPLDKTVNPRDIIFTLGRSKTSPATTAITDQRLMDQAAFPFTCQHKASSPEAPGCKCVLRGTTALDADADARQERADLQRLLTELNLDERSLPVPPLSHLQARQQSTCKCMRMQTSTDSITEDLDRLWSENGQNDFDAAETAVAQREKAETRKRNLGVNQQAKSPQLTEAVPARPTLCALCSADIGWVPPLAACPYCGFKSFTEPAEKPYDETATAKELLYNYFHERRKGCQAASDEDNSVPAAAAEDEEQDPNVPAQCACVSGRTCTRCRIRKLCEQMFKESNIKHLHVLPNSTKETEKDKLEKRESTVSQRRTQLVKIFTEMRNAYDRKKSTATLLNEPEEKPAENYCKKRKGGRKSARTCKSETLKRVLAELEQTYTAKKCKRRRIVRPRSKRYTFFKKKLVPRSNRIGHRCCISDSAHAGYSKIPCHMGWMWTKNELARYKCWKPGAIAKPIRTLMSYFLRDYPLDRICISRYHYRRRKRVDPVEEEPLVQHPTLHISKKNDEYTITLRPLKEPKALAVCANPYADMKPVVFRITKDPLLAEQRRLKRALKKLGFEYCRCQRPVAKCCCRSYIDKKRVSFELENLCRDHGVANMVDTFVYSESSDSEAEYDFGVTPPAGLTKPERLKVTNVANCQTQYCENDWAEYTMFPHQPNALTQYAACTGGERKAMFPWIYGKGNVHQEPKPPKMRNLPKKAKGKSKG
ncbi:uncharacterized protein LOC115621198 [Scaptodrosophila lebanonensis]|uniref:Uncharacterized protein LOC115621198 n=1 Tax=Drosophila lebanonensis TaxID=7225 RepID=A0A6J2T6T7_DROLE|nr:uncharacterized protein LOC115621198 [Scaptodrosophila lebanonensis]